MSGTPGFMTPKGPGSVPNPYSQDLTVPGAGNVVWTLSERQREFKNFMLYQPGTRSVFFLAGDDTLATVAAVYDFRIVPGIIFTWYRRSDETKVSFSVGAGPDIALEIIPYLIGDANH